MHKKVLNDPYGNSRFILDIIVIHMYVTQTRTHKHRPNRLIIRKTGMRKVDEMTRL